MKIASLVLEHSMFLVVHYLFLLTLAQTRVRSFNKQTEDDLVIQVLLSPPLEAIYFAQQQLLTFLADLSLVQRYWSKIKICFLLSSCYHSTSLIVG